MKKNILLIVLLCMSVFLFIFLLYYQSITNRVVNGMKEFFDISACITVSEEAGVYIVNDVQAFIEHMENKGFEFIDRLGGHIIFEKDKKHKDYDIKSRFEYFLIEDVTPKEKEEQYK